MERQAAAFEQSLNEYGTVQTNMQPEIKLWFFPVLLLGVQFPSAYLFGQFRIRLMIAQKEKELSTAEKNLRNEEAKVNKKNLEAEKNVNEKWNAKRPLLSNH